MEFIAEREKGRPIPQEFLSSLVFLKFFVFHLFTCAFIVWVISYPLALSPLSSLASRQNLFCPYL
jgi:hypothetical protein